MTTHLPILNEEPEAPRTFGDCLREGWGDHDVTGPCPWVRCSQHLAWARAMGGSGRACVDSPEDPRAIEKLDAVVEHELEEMPATCALRVASDPTTLEEIAQMLGLTRERIRQVEQDTFRRIQHSSRAHVLHPHRDEGREVSRPDLIETSTKIGLSRGTPDSAAFSRAMARVIPGAARDRADAQRRAGIEPDVIPARVYTGPPVRVLKGAEKRRRIAELKARGGAPVVTVNTKSTEETVVRKQATIEAAKRAVAALDEYIRRRGISQVQAMRELSISSSTVARMRSGVPCTDVVPERIEAAVAKLPEGDAARSAPGKRARTGPKLGSKAAHRAAAKPAPASSIASELARVAAVIDMLGGIDRAERIALALKEVA
jgi:hypothetical protein